MTQAAETPLPFEYAGRVVGFRNVEVRPRVGGLLLTREYVEGAKVKEGDVLFRIDPATYEVALSRAEAQRQQAQATLRQAEENFKRIEQLSSKAIATERQLDDAVAQRDQARASVQLAEAEIRNARLNLDYTTVVAPASGVTALQSPPVGTLIQAQQTLLTTITRLDPAYVMFSFTDTEAQDFRELNQRRAKPIVAEDLTVELHYSNGAIYPHTGKIDQSAQRVDLQTGTIEARAIFPNPDGALIPGPVRPHRDQGRHTAGRHRDPEPGHQSGAAGAIGLRRRREQRSAGQTRPARAGSGRRIGRAERSQERRAGHR